MMPLLACKDAVAGAARAGEYARHRPEQTLLYQLVEQSPSAGNQPADLAKSKRDAAFVRDNGVVEDRAAACSSQAGVAGRGNSHFTFGRFEKAAVHFHQHLAAHLERLASDQ